VVPSNYIPKIIEIDEIYIEIQGNREFYGWPFARRLCAVLGFQYSCVRYN
jgi:hypothetical protein